MPILAWSVYDFHVSFWSFGCHFDALLWSSRLERLGTRRNLEHHRL
jgi:hypothetical protein